MITFQLGFALTFWSCFAAIVYAYAVYPVLIWYLSRRFGHPGHVASNHSEHLPSVSLLIAAHNEMEVIEGRIRNALAIDYPRDSLEIVIAMDGCTDATASIVQRFTDHGIRALDFVQRRGKSSVLNAAMHELRGEIVVLSDANTDIDSSAVHQLVRWFQDPQVGVVCGRLILTDPSTGRNVDSLYWKFETFLKRCEGRLGALLGANGAIYAIRRTLYQPIPPETIIDDFVIPLLAKLRYDCTIIYDSTALANEETAHDVQAEFNRRARIGAGGFQSINILWRLLDPRRGWIAFTFLSHKLMRWLCPFFMLGTLISNLFLLDQRFYRVALICQLGFYFIAAVTPLMPPWVRFIRPFRLTTMFTLMNLALFVGFWRWIFGRQKGAWTRTPRVATVEGTGE